MSFREGDSILAARRGVTLDHALLSEVIEHRPDGGWGEIGPRSNPDDGRHSYGRGLRPAGVVLDNPQDALANDRWIIDATL